MTDATDPVDNTQLPSEHSTAKPKASPTEATQERKDISDE